MFCSRCHTPNFRADRYCRHCGGQLPAAGPVAPVDEEVEEQLRKALALLDQGDANDALVATQAALALEPGSPFGHSVLAHVYERQGRIPEAIQQLQIVIRVHPQSTADREKLAALTGASTSPEVAARSARSRPFFAAAAVACVVILCGGIYLGMITRQREDAALKNAGIDLTQGPIQSLPANAGTRASAPAAKPLVGPPLPTGLNRNATQSASAAQPQYPSGPPISTSTTPVTGRIGLPPVFDQPRNVAGASAGLSPAVIGEISPLTPEPQPASTQEGDSNGPGASAPLVVNGETPEPRQSEPIEAESGFIKVERTKPRVESPAAPRKQGPPPSISVTFGEGGSESLLLEAQREASRAEEAARTGNQSDAARRYRNAQRLYENIARRGGAEAPAARAGAENCRKALSALAGN